MVIIIVKNVEACVFEAIRGWASHSKVFEFLGYHIHIAW